MDILYQFKSSFSALEEAVKIDSSGVKQLHREFVEIVEIQVIGSIPLPEEVRLVSDWRQLRKELCKCNIQLKGTFIDKLIEIRIV